MRSGIVVLSSLATLSLGAIVNLSTTHVAKAFDNGQYSCDERGDKQRCEQVRSWFKSVRSPHDVPCCDISDGHRTAYDIRSDGYWVPIEGEWRQVPPDAIVYNAGNPVGEAVVWYVRQGVNTFYIRCFVPGGGVQLETKQDKLPG